MRLFIFWFFWESTDSPRVDVDYTISGLPSGVTVSSFTNDGGTGATLTLSGTPSPWLITDATVTVTILAAALDGAMDTSSTTFDIADEVVAAQVSPDNVNESATFNQTFTITMTKDQLTGASDNDSIAGAVSLSGDFTGLNVGVAGKTSVNEFTINVNGNLVFNTGTGTITLNNGQMTDDADVSVDVTINDVAPTISFATASINESATDTATNVLTLTRDTFSTAGAMTVDVDYTISGLPSGVTVSSFTNDGGTGATLTFLPIT